MWHAVAMLFHVMSMLIPGKPAVVFTSGLAIVLQCTGVAEHRCNDW